MKIEYVPNCKVRKQFSKVTIIRPWRGICQWCGINACLANCAGNPGPRAEPDLGAKAISSIIRSDSINHDHHIFGIFH